MKKTLFSLAFLGFTYGANAQVGIGTTVPAATLDIVGEPSVNTSLDAVIPPRLTGNQLKTKTYTTAQNGAVVFVTAAVSTSVAADQTANVNMPGLYYFDGPTLKWIYLGSNPVMTNFRSTLYQALNLSDTGDQVITFTNSDSVINLATTFDDASDEFTILFDGVYQISAFIGFNANQPNLTDARDFVAVNLKIQISTTTVPTWTGATGIRSVFPGITAGTGTSIQIPTTILSLKKGDKLRYVIQRPSLTIGTSPNNKSNSNFGDFGVGNGHINLPGGQTYTKSFTILKVK